jgi:hypothetical protein
MQVKSKCIFMSCHQNVNSELLYRILNNSFENVENSEQWLTVKMIFTKEFKSRFNLGNGYYSPYLESNFFVLNGGLVQCNRVPTCKCILFHISIFARYFYSIIVGILFLAFVSVLRCR